MKYFYLILVLLSICFTACKQEDPPKFHFEYFGMEEGRYVVYDVVEIFHDDAQQAHDTTRYQMKTLWADVYIDNEGREGREYIIFKRDDATLPWGLTDVWHGVFDGIRGELIEENQRRVKLVFAPTTAKEWDANAYNLDEYQECYYRDIHGDTILNGAHLDSTLVVEMMSIKHALYDRRIYEVYKKHVGLVYKHYKYNTHFFASPVVDFGTELYMTYVTTGIQ
ncbi:MAG: hypothetical protein QNK23_05525 [Crocinitomicaceae bacterium]|nr:hypothetical protein [Crocinitomicaceae bacterium]